MLLSNVYSPNLAKSKGSAKHLALLQAPSYISYRHHPNESSLSAKDFHLAYLLKADVTITLFKKNNDPKFKLNYSTTLNSRKVLLFD